MKLYIMMQWTIGNYGWAMHLCMHQLGFSALVTNMTRTLGRTGILCTGLLAGLNCPNRTIP